MPVENWRAVEFNQGFILPQLHQFYKQLANPKHGLNEFAPIFPADYVKSIFYLHVLILTKNRLIGDFLIILSGSERGTKLELGILILIIHNTHYPSLLTSFIKNSYTRNIRSRYMCG